MEPFVSCVPATVLLGATITLMATPTSIRTTTAVTVIVRCMRSSSQDDPPNPGRTIALAGRNVCERAHTSAKFKAGTLDRADRPGHYVGCHLRECLVESTDCIRRLGAFGRDIRGEDTRVGNGAFVADETRGHIN